MRTDLKVNFSALTDLSYHLKKYQGDVEDVEKELSKLNSFLDKQESKALKKLKDDINEDDEYFLNLIEELKDLTKKIDSYVISMENYVAAETPGEITRVDTLDIKSNLKSMRRSVTSNNYWFDKTLPGCSYSFTGDKTKQLEQQQKYERNYDKLENFRKSYLVPLNKKLDQGIQDLFKIYSDYIEPFEKEDDIHRKNLDKSYKKYTSKKNKIKNGVKFSLKIGGSFLKHLAVAAGVIVALAVILLLPTTVLVIGGIAVVAGLASVAAIPEKYFGGGLLKRLKVSVDETVNLVKQGPVKVAKVIANDFADTVQTPEGVAGVVGDITGMVVGGKIAKAIKTPQTPVSKTGETDIPVEDVKTPGEVNTKPVDKLKDTVDDIKTKTDIESKTPDVGDVGKVESEISKNTPIENGPYIKDGKPHGRPVPTGKAKLQFEQDVYNRQVGPDGVLREPYPPYREINWKPGEPRKGVVDFGHVEGKSYKEMFLKYKNGEITLEELKEFQSNPENFRIEIPSSNRNHSHE
ncbi:MAG: hypothetical protein IKS48_10600 [Eubacterium sp.]|nr:hypothetical protein [Eubacterium sp.]